MTKNIACHQHHLEKTNQANNRLEGLMRNEVFYRESITRKAQVAIEIDGFGIRGRIGEDDVN